MKKIKKRERELKKRELDLRERKIDYKERKFNKKIGVVALIFLTLMIQTTSAFAWMDTEVINDYSNDMVMYDEELYEKYEFDTDDNPNSDLDAMHESFSKHWYDEKATVLTEEKNEDYAYIDILDISKEVVSDKLVIKIRTRGNLDKEDFWMCFLWNNDMLIMFTKIGDTFRLYDLDNDASYTGKFYDTDDQFITRFSGIDEEAWEGTDIKFISIGMNSDNDIIVDINPNPVNLVLIYTTTAVIVLIVVLFAVAVYYKNKNN